MDMISCDKTAVKDPVSITSVLLAAMIKGLDTLYSYKNIIYNETANSNYITNNNHTSMVNSQIISTQNKDTVDFLLKHESTLISMLSNEVSESCHANQSEIYFIKMLNKNKTDSLFCINKIFSDFISKEKQTNIIVNILHLLSHIDYKDIYPTAQTIAYSALRHKDCEVKDYAIKCFENWNDPDGARLLKTIDFSSDDKWFQDYVIDVIEELEKLEDVK